MNLSKPLETLVSGVTIATVIAGVMYFNQSALMYHYASGHFRKAEQYQREGDLSEAAYQNRRAKTELIPWNYPSTIVDKVVKLAGLLFSGRIKKLNSRINRLDVELIMAQPAPSS